MNNSELIFSRVINESSSTDVSVHTVKQTSSGTFSVLEIKILSLRVALINSIVNYGTIFIDDTNLSYY